MSSSSSITACNPPFVSYKISGQERSLGVALKDKGLYYVDELTTSGTVMLAHGTSEREAWLWHRRLGHPSVLTLEPKVFGCTVFAHIPKSYRDKLDPCAEKCVFVGYGVNQKGYRCYNPKTRHMITTMNCDFLETKYFYSSQHSGQGERECIDTLSWLSYGTHEGGRNHSTHNESPFSTQPEDPNVSDAQEAPNLIPEVSNTHSSPMSEPIETTNNTSGQGESIQEQEMFATQNDTNVEQNEHMEEQVNFPTQEDTSGRYVLPPRANRGVPPKRYSPEKVSRGSRYPIANIAKGNLSEEAKAFALSMYSDEIPANTEQALKSKHWKDAMEEEIKALIKNNTWEKRVLPPGNKTVGCRGVFTIKYKLVGTIERYKARLNDFLHGELKEEIYMEAPRGFTESFGEREVCLLKKSLYGLKQSPRAWFGRFTLAMKHYVFKQSNSDHTLFLKQRDNLITCLIIYVDDMIITRNDKEEITKLKKNLFTEFEMKDLGRLKYFLVIEVLRSKHGILMYQKKYVLDLLAEIGMVDCKPADTLMIVNHKLYMEKKARLADKGRYQRMVGKLIYLSHTRPDIAHVVGVTQIFPGDVTLLPDQNKGNTSVYQTEVCSRFTSRDHVWLIANSIGDTPMIVNQMLIWTKKKSRLADTKWVVVKIWAVIDKDDRKDSILSVTLRLVWWTLLRGEAKTTKKQNVGGPCKGQKRVDILVVRGTCMRVFTNTVALPEPVPAAFTFLVSLPSQDTGLPSHGSNRNNHLRCMSVLNRPRRMGFSLWEKCAALAMAGKPWGYILVDILTVKLVCNDATNQLPKSMVEQERLPSLRQCKQTAKIWRFSLSEKCVALEMTAT
ncbi:putative ribonuclease H-like domain-containing protein [Tanacetum coccineum]